MPNPLDEFVTVGPSRSALARHGSIIGTTGALEEPIIVRPLGDGTYEIVNGHHRWAAAKARGWTTIPAEVVK